MMLNAKGKRKITALPQEVNDTVFKTKKDQQKLRFKTLTTPLKIKSKPQVKFSQMQEN